MKRIWGIVAAALLGVATPAYADALIEAVPTNWRLQNYVNSGVTAYFTGSSCISGGLSFGPSATSDDKNRFWSLIMTAKALGKTVGIYYETTSGLCQITSFYET